MFSSFLHRSFLGNDLRVVDLISNFISWDMEDLLVQLNQLGIIYERHI